MDIILYIIYMMLEIEDTFPRNDGISEYRNNEFYSE